MTCVSKPIGSTLFDDRTYIENLEKGCKVTMNDCTSFILDVNISWEIKEVSSKRRLVDINSALFKELQENIFERLSPKDFVHVWVPDSTICTEDKKLLEDEFLMVKVVLLFTYHVFRAYDLISIISGQCALENITGSCVNVSHLALCWVYSMAYS